MMQETVFLPLVSLPVYGQPLYRRIVPIANICLILESSFLQDEAVTLNSRAEAAPDREGKSFLRGFSNGASPLPIEPDFSSESSNNRLGRAGVAGQQDIHGGLCVNTSIYADIIWRDMPMRVCQCTTEKKCSSRRERVSTGFG